MRNLVACVLFVILATPCHAGDKWVFLSGDSYLKIDSSKTDGKVSVWIKTENARNEVGMVMWKAVLEQHRIDCAAGTAIMTDFIFVDFDDTESRGDSVEPPLETPIPKGSDLAKARRIACKQ